MFGLNKSRPDPKTRLKPRYRGIIVGLLLGLPLLLWLPWQSDFYRDAEWRLASVVNVGPVQTHEGRAMQRVTLVLKGSGEELDSIRRFSLWLAVDKVRLKDNVRVWYNPSVPPYIQIVYYQIAIYWGLIVISSLLLIQWIMARKAGKLENYR